MKTKTKIEIKTEFIPIVGLAAGYRSRELIFVLPFISIEINFGKRKDKYDL